MDIAPANLLDDIVLLFDCAFFTGFLYKAIFGQGHISCSLWICLARNPSMRCQLFVSPALPLASRSQGCSMHWSRWDSHMQIFQGLPHLVHTIQKPKAARSHHFPRHGFCRRRDSLRFGPPKRPNGRTSEVVVSHGRQGWPL